MGIWGTPMNCPTIEIGPLAQRWVSGLPNHGLKLQETTGAVMSVVFASREHAADAGVVAAPPALLVTWTNP